MAADRLETIWIDEDTLLTAMEISGQTFFPLDCVIENLIIGEAFKRQVRRKQGRLNG